MSLNAVLLKSTHIKNTLLAFVLKHTRLQAIRQHQKLEKKTITPRLVRFKQTNT